MTDKMADKVVKEGHGAVDKEDLLLLSDLEELRAEMLLVGTRSFQSRYQDLGTRFTAIMLPIIQERNKAKGDACYG